jgi:hypothetical protein
MKGIKKERPDNQPAVLRHAEFIYFCCSEIPREKERELSLFLEVKEKKKEREKRTRGKILPPYLKSH